jgi:glycosyltransferase involved in cell wall biosynthesis
VINDLSTDQRVARACSVMQYVGFQVVLIGRRFANSAELKRDYSIKRFRFFVNKGPLFYFFYNVRLFFYLLTRKKLDVLYANDLDTLGANALVSIIRRKPLIYDSHEYFLGVPEIQQKRMVKWVWKSIERFCLPWVDTFITVNDSIAKLYSKVYKKEIFVIRNMTLRSAIHFENNSTDLDLPKNTFVMVMQGAGINIDRGYEEAILSMKYIDHALLLIIGKGDVIDDLKNLVKQQNLESKVWFLGVLPYAKMMQYTAASHLGLTLDKDLSINYKFSLPNKLFDYINAGTPVLGSNLPEVAKIINDYEVGMVIEEVSPESIAKAINELIEDKERYNFYRQKCQRAAQVLNWETEQKKLNEIIDNYV